VNTLEGSDDSEDDGADASQDVIDGSRRGLKNPRTIARILGVILFGLLYWLQSPPAFLRGAGFASYLFVVVLWLGELLVYAVCVAGILVILIFAGSHLYHLLHNARRWFRLQEIRSWRAKRACNFPDKAK
jgi:hypothetical protein